MSGASKPEYQNMRYTNHQYMTKKKKPPLPPPQFLQKKSGMSASDATFSMQAFKINVLIWGMFMSSSMEAAIHLGPNYLTNSEIYNKTKFEQIGCVFNIAEKLVMEHSEEILNVKCLEYSSPSWARSVLANDQAIKWAKAKVCVYADTVPCVGQMKDISGATERWKGQVEDLKKYSSYNFSQDFRLCIFFARSRTTWRQRTSSQKTSRTRSSSCQCSTTFECRRSQELRHEVLARTLDVSGSRIGRKVIWRFPRSKRDSGIAPPTKWYSDSKRLVILSSKAPVL